MTIKYIGQSEVAWKHLISSTFLKSVNEIVTHG